jgi:hypothetical protein
MADEGSAGRAGTRAGGRRDAPSVDLAFHNAKAARERGAAPPPPLGRKARRALAARQRALASANRTLLDGFHAARRPGRCLVQVRVLAPRPAGLDPVFGPGVRAAAAAALAAALGVPDGDFRECFACAAPWRPDRAPALVALVEFSNPPSGGVGLICEACSAGGAEAVDRRALAAIRRDFLPDAEPVPASALAPEGGTA